MYDGYEEGTVKEIEGITDKVSDMSFTGISYPAIVFKEGFKLERHKVVVISNMVKSQAGNMSKDITLYFQNNGELYKMGTLSGFQIMSLLDIVPRDSLLAFYSDGKLLEGSLIYTLCSF